MSLISLVVVLIVVGVLLALLNRYVGQWIDGTILKIINAVVIIAVVLWVLSLFVNLGGLNTIRVGR